MSAALKRPVETGSGYTVTEEQLAKLGDGDVRAGRKALRMMLADAGPQEPINGPFDYPAEVMIGTPGDEAELVRLMKLELREVGGAAIAPVSNERLIATVRPSLHRQQGIVGVIPGTEPGRLAAYIVLVPQQWWWSEAQHICEIASFVDPAYRHTPFGRRLLQFANWVADEWTRGFGYRIYLLTNVLNADGSDRKARMWSRYGNRSGAFFLYPDPRRA